MKKQFTFLPLMVCLLGMFVFIGSGAFAQGNGNGNGNGNGAGHTGVGTSNHGNGQGQVILPPQAQANGQGFTKGTGHLNGTSNISRCERCDRALDRFIAVYAGRVEFCVEEIDCNLIVLVRAYYNANNEFEVVRLVYDFASIGNCKARVISITYTNPPVPGDPCDYI